ncbi:hypothetical protein YC2023_111669 [Brassica napus]
MGFNRESPLRARQKLKQNALGVGLCRSNKWDCAKPGQAWGDVSAARQLPLWFLKDRSYL